MTGEAKGTTATKAGIGVGAGVVVNLVDMTNLATTGRQPGRRATASTSRRR